MKTYGKLMVKSTSTQQWTHVSFSVVPQHSCPLWYTPLRENWGLRIESHIGISSFLKIEICAFAIWMTFMLVPNSWLSSINPLAQVVHNSWTEVRPESCISSIYPATNVLSTCLIPGGLLTFSKTSICSHCVSGSKWHLQKLQQISFHALVTHTKLDDS
jgi:hypothetical protein